MTTLEAAGFSFEPSSVKNGKIDFQNTVSWRNYVSQQNTNSAPEIIILPEKEPTVKGGALQVQTLPELKPMAKVNEPQIHPPKNLVIPKTPQMTKEQLKFLLGQKAKVGPKISSRKFWKKVKDASEKHAALS